VFFEENLPLPIESVHCINVSGQNEAPTA